MRKLTLILLFAASPAMPDGMINGVPVDCYCTDRQGERVEIGETICLQVDGRMFTAQCQMALNVPIWREISPSCVSSDLSIDDGLEPTINTGGIHPKI